VPIRPTSYWVTRRAARRPVSMPSVTCSTRPSPDPCESSSSSRAVSPLRSLCAPPSCRLFPVGASYRGFIPLRDITESVHSTRRLTYLRYGPSSGFLNLSTGSSAYGFVGLFHPTATSRVSPFRGFSRLAAVADSSPARAPMVFPECSLTGKPAATITQATYEAFIHETKRSSRSGFSLPLRRSPLRLLSSSRNWPPRRKPGSPGHPLMPFSTRSSPGHKSRSLAPPGRLQRVVDGLADARVAAAPSCSRFAAYRMACHPVRPC
jgi:hypothetical protein